MMQFALAGLTAANLIGKGIDALRPPSPVKVDSELNARIAHEYNSRQELHELQELVKKLQGNPDLLKHLSPMDQADLQMSLQGAVVQVADAKGHLAAGKVEKLQILDGKHLIDLFSGTF